MSRLGLHTRIGLARSKFSKFTCRRYVLPSSVLESGLSRIRFRLLVVKSEGGVAPISEPLSEAITDGSAVHVLSLRTVRRYEPRIAVPVWTRTFPYSRTNIGFDEDGFGRLVVTSMRFNQGAPPLPEELSIEVVETLNGETIVGAPVPFIDLDKNPGSFDEFVVVNGNLTGIFRRVAYREPVWLLCPGKSSLGFRTESVVNSVYTGSGSEFVVAFWNNREMILGITDVAIPRWLSPRVTLDPNSDPYSTLNLVEMVADSGADVLYLAAFGKNDTLFVHRFKLSSLEEQWFREVATLKMSGVGFGLAIRKGHGQVVIGFVGGGDAASETPGDVVVAALDDTSGSIAWETRLETPGKDTVGRVLALDDGLIAVVGRLNQTSDFGESSPICFFNETGPVR